MTTLATAFLVYGPTAAGKSTFAKKLSAERNAVRFAVDEWMHGLFGDDKPETMDVAWVMPRVARCQSRIWACSVQILATGTDVVLEMGLLRAHDRHRMQSVVEDAGYRAAFCFVDADRQVRRQRALQRNVDRGDTYSFDVTPGMFDAMETIFEHPNAAELRRSQVITEENTHAK